MLVLFKPVQHYLLGNKLFELNSSYKGWHLESYAYLAQLAKKQNIELATWDMHPLEEATIIIMQDLPATKVEMEEIKKKAPKAKLILMNVETPLGRTYMWEKRNHQLFDAILTYNQSICDEKRYYHYFLPVDEQPITKTVPFLERRPLTIINTNRLLGPAGVLYFRQRGLQGLPGFGVFFSGWKVGLKSFLQLTKGETYSVRRNIARLAEKDFPDLLDIYGYGWAGESVGWPHSIISPRPYRSYKVSSEEKSKILSKYRFALAYENMVGSGGYISEKIFDCLYAGVVPIYLGEKNIQDYVWASAFVDARNFKSHRELLTYVRDCPESQWQQHIEHGKSYLHSDEMKKFQKENFAETVLGVIKKVAYN